MIILLTIALMVALVLYTTSGKEMTDLFKYSSEKLERPYHTLKELGLRYLSPTGVSYFKTKVFNTFDAVERKYHAQRFT